MVVVSLMTTTQRFAMTSHRVFFACTAVAITACAPSVRITGEVNGNTLPPVVSAAYVPFEDEDNDRVGLNVLLTTMPDACAFATDFFRAVNDLTTARTRNDEERAADDLGDAITSNNVVGEWAIDLGVYADREDDLRDEFDIEVDPDDEDSSRANVIFFQDEPDIDLDEGVFDPNVDEYRADDGAIVWDLDDDRTHVDFEATLELREFADETFGDRAGEITISGRAQRCTSWEDVVTD
jgi:hypothetical protein